MYAKFTTNLFAQSVELRSKELLWSKETACFNNIFKFMFIFFKETEGLIFVDFVKILIINLLNQIQLGIKLFHLFQLREHVTL